MNIWYFGEKDCSRHGRVTGNKRQRKREKMVEMVAGTKSDNIVYHTLIHRHFGEDLGFAQYIGWGSEPS